jgi:hypothetical protein
VFGGSQIKVRVHHIFENIARSITNNFQSSHSHFANAIAIGIVNSTTVALFNTNDAIVINAINKKYIIFGLQLLFFAITIFTYENSPEFTAIQTTNINQNNKINVSWSIDLNASTGLKIQKTINNIAHHRAINVFSILSKKNSIIDQKNINNVNIKLKFSI